MVLVVKMGFFRLTVGTGVVNRSVLWSLDSSLVVRVMEGIIVVVMVRIRIMDAVVKVVDVVVVVVVVVGVGTCTIQVTGTRALLVPFWMNLNVSKLPSKALNQVAQFSHFLLNLPQISNGCRSLFRNTVHWK